MSQPMFTLPAVRPERLLVRILGGDVGNVHFADLVRLVEALGSMRSAGRAAIGSSLERLWMS